MSENPVSIWQGNFRGWDGFFLKNEFIRLVAVPAIGGRIMALDLDEEALFFIDPRYSGKLFSAEENLGDGSLAAWKNYGGDKTWPAPQGWDNDQQWHGPPDPVLDTGIYTVDKFMCDGEQAVICMVSPPDPRTGVQIRRQFTMRAGSSRIHVDLSFLNISEKPVRWSIWDVVQLRAEKTLPNGQLTHDPECVVTIPFSPNSRFPHGYNVMFGAEDNPQWQANPETGLMTIPYLWEIGKIGVDSTDGWIAFHNGSAGVGFTEQFSVDPAKEYPDEGATVECWTVGAGQVANLNFSDLDIYHMETEVLGPLETIPPGETISFSIVWGTAFSHGPIIKTAPAGCVSKAMGNELQKNMVLLTGSYGVFDAGILHLRWLTGAGELLDEQALGRATPLQPVILNENRVCPAGAERVELVVVANADGAARLLDAIEI